MIDRRTLIRASMAAALTMVGQRSAFSALSPTASQSPDTALAALLQRLAEEHLRRSPEEATQFEFDTGAQAGLRSRLNDRSLEAVVSQRAAAEKALVELGRIDRTALGASARLDYDVAMFVYSTLKDQLARYGTVDLNLRPSPYVVCQMNGAYYWLPDYLGSHHPLRTAEDVSAYFDRLSALAAAVDQETERMRHDVASGVIPPSFVLETTISQIEELMQTPPERGSMIGPAIKRAAAARLGDISERAQRIFRSKIIPALTRQLAALRALQSRADSKAGVWKLPEGEVYYASALHSNTTSSRSAADLHRFGLDLAADITAQLDMKLRAQGYTKGSVMERVQALNQDARFLAPDSDAGREQLLAAARAAVDKARGLLPAAFGTIPDNPINVVRMPVAIEAGAPGARYREGSPGTFQLNLRYPQKLPLWRLPTLAHHEGIPGHHFQHSVMVAAGSLPLFRQIVQFSAYTEGWALYAERVADEIGVYRDDPFGQIGLLQSELFRAGRIVVDTGLHHKRWSREHATDWMVEQVGEPRVVAQREIDRYCVYPGQACSFMVGATEIRAAREQARKRLGARFDVRAFHDIVLRSGSMPMEVMHALVERA